MGVGVDVELVADRVGEGLDLGVEAAQHSDEGQGHRAVGFGVGAGGSAGCGQQSLMQDGGLGSAGVADLFEPFAQTCRGEPVGLGLGGEPFDETQADRGVEFGEEVHGAWEDDLQVRAELVGGRDPVLDEVTACSHAGAQGPGRRARAGQRGQSSSVGAHDVGQDVGVEPVVFVAGRSVARAQVLDLVRADHQHGQLGGQEGLDDGSVAPFDTDLGHLSGQESSYQASEALSGVSDGESVDHLAVGVQDAHDVVVLGPVQAGTHSRSRRFRRHTHLQFLAVGAVREHPVVPGPCSRSLTDRRSSAHSPVAGPRVLGHRTSQNSCWTSRVERQWRWPGGDQGCISSPSGTADKRMVHQ